MGNFNFLEKIDKNLYDIISDAEKLYRDEYFEQCISQTRRFGENICKNVLGDRRTAEKTFDEMLATLKYISSKNEQEKEFIDDLYFLKREGNTSVHSSKVKQDGILALECLKRAFEISINYCVYNQKAKSNLLKLRYDTNLLITGKKEKPTLEEKYTQVKKQNKLKKISKHTKNKDVETKKSSNIFSKIFFIFSVIVSILIFLIINILVFI